mgnify:CR=1 FL=1
MKRHWQRWVAGALVAAVLVGPMPAVAQEPAAAAVEEAAPLQVAQQQQPRRRRTLMDLLFGNDEEEQRQQDIQVVDEPAVVRAPAQATLPPAKPAVEKAVGATRLAVFGDSMAVDLARGLERERIRRVAQPSLWDALGADFAGTIVIEVDRGTIEPPFESVRACAEWANNLRAA